MKNSLIKVKFYFTAILSKWKTRMVSNDHNHHSLVETKVLYIAYIMDPKKAGYHFLDSSRIARPYRKKFCTASRKWGWCSLQWWRISVCFTNNVDSSKRVTEEEYQKRKCVYCVRKAGLWEPRKRWWETWEAAQKPPLRIRKSSKDLIWVWCGL